MSRKAGGRGQNRSVLERAREAASELYKREATLAEIGRLAGGIKQPSVSEWKDGSPSITTARIFAKATGVCVEWLLTERGPKRPWDTEAEMDPLLSDLRRIWESLTESARRELVNYARYLDMQSSTASERTTITSPTTILRSRRPPGDGGTAA